MADAGHERRFSVRGFILHRPYISGAVALWIVGAVALAFQWYRTGELNRNAWYLWIEPAGGSRVTVTVDMRQPRAAVRTLVARTLTPLFRSAEDTGHERDVGRFGYHWSSSPPSGPASWFPNDGGVEMTARYHVVTGHPGTLPAAVLWDTLDVVDEAADLDELLEVECERVTAELYKSLRLRDKDPKDLWPPTGHAGQPPLPPAARPR
jgi:hypothetical protein